MKKGISYLYLALFINFSQIVFLWFYNQQTIERLPIIWATSYLSGIAVVVLYYKGIKIKRRGKDEEAKQDRDV